MIVDNKVATEPRAPSGKADVITSLVLRSTWLG